MNLIFAPQVWEDDPYWYWRQADPKTVGRIHQPIKDIARCLYASIGKSEPLRHALRGCWSRRIDAEHRIVYRVAEEGVLIERLRYHY